MLFFALKYKSDSLDFVLNNAITDLSVTDVGILAGVHLSFRNHVLAVATPAFKMLGMIHQFKNPHVISPLLQ